MSSDLWLSNSESVHLWVMAGICTKFEKKKKKQTNKKQFGSVGRASVLLSEGRWFDSPGLAKQPPPFVYEWITENRRHLLNVLKNYKIKIPHDPSTHGVDKSGTDRRTAGQFENMSSLQNHRNVILKYLCSSSTVSVYQWNYQLHTEPNFLSNCSAARCSLPED